MAAGAIPMGSKVAGINVVRIVGPGWSSLIVLCIMSQLCDAVSNGDINTVRRLIKYEHASPHYRVNNYKLRGLGSCSKLTPLHVAA